MKRSKGKRGIAAVAASIAVAALLAGCSAKDAMPEPAQPAAAKVASVPAKSGAYVHGQLIVGLDAAASEQNTRRALEDAGLAVADTLMQADGDFGAMLLVETAGARSEGAALQDAAREAANVPGVEYVQPNYRCASASAKATDLVNDPQVGKQYYLDGPESCGANIAEAWKKLEDAGIDPSTKVDVAVLDTGVYVMNASDPKSIYGSDGQIDPLYLHQEFDAENLDTARAKDYVHAAAEDAALPLVNDKFPDGDDNGHGTHIAGIIAANAKSAYTPDELPLGMAGVSHNARVVPCKVLDANGEGDTADFVRAYNDLMSASGPKNLHVVNMSLAETAGEDEPGIVEGEDADDSDLAGVEDDAPEDFTVEVETETTASADNEALHAAIKAAEQAGIVTVCAAGNDSSTSPTFPSDFEECVSVTALDADGGNADFSNYNEDKDISAPGTDMYSAWATQADAYATQTGTSQATAVVSGVLSMLWAANPKLTVEQAKAAIYNTARPVLGKTQHIAADAKGVYSRSHGAIDAAAAVEYVLASARGQAPKSLADGNCKIELGGTGEDGKPELAVTYDDRTLAEGTDYEVEWIGSKGRGAAVVVEGTGEYAGWTVERLDAATASELNAETWGNGPEEETADASAGSLKIADGTAKIAKAKYTYTGKKIKPAVTLSVNGKKLKKGTDYSVSYKNNKLPGTATITLKGKGKYSGTKKVKFKIALGTTKITKVVQGKKTLTIKWKRQKKGGVGYRVRYSTKKSMKGAKKKLVGKNATTSLKLKGLRSSKRYYAQIRTHKKIGGKRFCSAWSAAKQ